MIRRVRGAMRWLLVTIGIVILTSFTVDATLNNNGISQSALGILATSLTETDQSGCPSGMVPLPGISGTSCVDQYEASASESCSFSNPENLVQSKDNINDPSCNAVSEAGRTPWRNLTREQAATACARAGKRLPTNEEWYRAALGTPDSEINAVCNLGDEISDTGDHEQCVSPIGAYDMVGNVWEWVSGDVFTKTFEGRELPDSGFVTQVDSNGVAVASEDEHNGLFSSDYVWTTQATGTYAMIRGGYFGNGSDAGVYALNAFVLPTTPGTAIGFRCVQ